MLIMFLMLMIVPVIESQAAGFEDESWEDWLQNDSSYRAVSDSGCRVVSAAKMIAESGVNPDITPDELYEWGLEHGAFSKGKSGLRILENGGFGTLLTGYVRDAGFEIEKITSVSIAGKRKSAVSSMIMDYLSQGYYVSLMCTAHTAYVGQQASLDAETPVILDSGIWRGEESNRILYTGNTHYSYSRMFVYRITIPEENRMTDLLAPKTFIPIE